jgi:hypothetical protein
MREGPAGGKEGVVVSPWRVGGCLHRGKVQRRNHIRLVGSEHIMHVAGTHCFRLEQPMDCGRMIPPTGEAGIAHWMRVDPTVFWGREALWQHLMRRPL